LSAENNKKIPLNIHLAPPPRSTLANPKVIMPLLPAFNVRRLDETNGNLGKREIAIGAKDNL
jgi:hypothetical protein